MVGKATSGTKGNNQQIDPSTPQAPDNIPMTIWVPIYHGMATLWEMRNRYSINDCFLMIEAIEYKDKVDSYYIKKAEAKSKRGR